MQAIFPRLIPLTILGVLALPCLAQAQADSAKLSFGGWQR
jgi:hypothetical protein